MGWGAVGKEAVLKVVGWTGYPVVIAICGGRVAYSHGNVCGRAFL